MYERFTDSARRILQRANKNAQRFNNEYVGTNDVLLGALEDADVVKLLEDAGTDVEELRIRLVSRIPIQPDMITFGKSYRLRQGRDRLSFTLWKNWKKRPT